MPKFSLPRAAFVLVTLASMVIVVALVVMAPTVTEAAAALQTTSDLRGTVRFSDGSLCHYNSTFFNAEVYPLIQQVDGNGNPVAGGDPPAGATALGLYAVGVVIQPTATVRLRVTCEGAVATRDLNSDEVANLHADIVLPNKKPVAQPIVARFNGVPVQAVRAGSTIKATVAVTDPDGDPLHYRWGASDGNASNNDAPEATWTLPNSRGLHFLYVLVSDGKGGYEEKQLAISTDAGMVPAAGGVRLFLPAIAKVVAAVTKAVSAAVAAVLNPSDHTPANDHFLTFPAVYAFSTRGVIGPLDNRLSACQYYRDLGVIGGCTADGHPTGPQLTFSAWKTAWGFGTPGNNEAKARYANLADLNLQRDMHTLSKSGIPRPNGGTGTDVASYVCNYPNPTAPEDPALSNVMNDTNMVACVAFEFSVTKSPTSTFFFNGGQPFTKFLTFGPTGDLLYSVNLDTRGEKFIPGACVACHGGRGYSGQYGLAPSTVPNLDAQFVPYDLDNYAFSNRPGFSRPEQEDQLRRLNEFVLDTNPYSRTVELINGWYQTSTLDGKFVPQEWRVTPADNDLYLSVVKPQCRMCHLSLNDADFYRNLNFGDPANFQAWAFNIGRAVCAAGSTQRYFYEMPNAKQTFDRFWNSIGGPNGVDEPAALLAYLQAQGLSITTCELPSWLP